MSKLKVSGISSKIFLSLLIMAGSASFFIFPTLPLVQWLAAVLSVISISLIFLDNLFEFVFLVMNFLISYAIYGILFTYGFPLWVIIIAVATMAAVISILLPIINNENKLLFGVFYSLVCSEIYMALSFWLINPLTRSLIICIFAYLFVGFNKSKKDKAFDKRNFLTYFYVSLFTIVLILSTVTWGH